MFNYLRNNWALGVEYATHFCITTAVLCGLTALVLLLTGFCELALASEPVTRIKIETIVQIESSGDSMAYNRHSEARGLMQITPICLKEYNQYNKEYYTLEHLFDEQINITIGTWYINKRIPQMLRHYGIEDTVDNRLYAYNAGIGRVIKGIMPKETKDYIAKYTRLTE